MSWFGADWGASDWEASYWFGGVDVAPPEPPPEPSGALRGGAGGRWVVQPPDRRPTRRRGAETRPIPRVPPVPVVPVRVEARGAGEVVAEAEGLFEVVVPRQEVSIELAGEVVVEAEAGASPEVVEVGLGAGAGILVDVFLEVVHSIPEIEDPPVVEAVVIEDDVWGMVIEWATPTPTLQAVTIEAMAGVEAKAEGLAHEEDLADFLELWPLAELVE